MHPPENRGGVHEGNPLHRGKGNACYPNFLLGAPWRCIFSPSGNDKISWNILISLLYHPLNWTTLETLPILNIGQINQYWRQGNGLIRLFDIQENQPSRSSYLLFKKTSRVNAIRWFKESKWFNAIIRYSRDTDGSIVEHCCILLYFIVGYSQLLYHNLVWNII